MSLPPVSVIVCTRNRPGFVHDTIASIARGDTVPAEIVVVDQSDLPDDELSSMAIDGCEVVYRHVTPRGVSAARNEAIAISHHDVLVFVDDDVLVPETWFRELVSALVRHGDHAVVTGQVREGDPEVPGGWAPSVMTDPEPTVHRGRVGHDPLYPNSMALHRAAIVDAGPYDERLGPGRPRFPAGEDNDFAYRLLEAGYAIHYEPAAIVHHRAWRPPSDFLRLKWQYGRGQGGFYGKHVWLGDRHVLWRLVRDTGSLGRRALRDLPRSRRASAGHLVFLGGMLSAFAEWSATRRRDPRPTA
jgi:glycosyltransferase involved in cell wall biosynthesis